MMQVQELAVVVEAGALSPGQVNWHEVRAQLEEAKAGIVEGISRYPRPIPACDSHFNYLLEVRAAILQEIGEVQEILKQERSAEEHIALFADFLRSSRFLHGDAEGKIQQRAQL